MDHRSQRRFERSRENQTPMLEQSRLAYRCTQWHRGRNERGDGNLDRYQQPISDRLVRHRSSAVYDGALDTAAPSLVVNRAAAPQPSHLPSARRRTYSRMARLRTRYSARRSTGVLHCAESASALRRSSARESASRAGCDMRASCSVSCASNDSSGTNSNRIAFRMFFSLSGASTH